MLDVGALAAFVAVIDTGSFSGAAERLGQTPSGVSRTIARLEKRLGMTLVHRTTRRILADLDETGSLAAHARTAGRPIRPSLRTRCCCSDTTKPTSIRAFRPRLPTLGQATPCWRWPAAACWPRCATTSRRAAH